MRWSEIRLEHAFGTDDLSDASIVGLPLTPRPVGDGPRLWVARLPVGKLTKPFRWVN